MAVTIQGLIGRALLASDPAERADAENLATLLAAVQRTIFCPLTGALLDVRTAVFIELDGHAPAIMVGPAWDSLARNGAGAALIERGATVTDGRDFTANGKRRAARKGA